MVKLARISSYDYQNLEGIIKHEIPLVITDSRKFKAFREYGQLSFVKAMNTLRPGTGPTVRVSDLGPSVYGQYRAGDEIHINEVIVHQHQMILDSWVAGSLPGMRNRERWLALVKKATLVLESVILHELVHWGDSKADGFASDNEARQLGWKDVGHMFVAAAYGRSFAIEREKIGRKYKAQKLSIEGWLGWDTGMVDGKRYVWPYDPWYGRGPGSGPPLPPGRP